MLDLGNLDLGFGTADFERLAFTHTCPKRATQVLTGQEKEGDETKGERQKKRYLYINCTRFVEGSDGVWGVVRSEPSHGECVSFDAELLMLMRLE